MVVDRTGKIIGGVNPFEGTDVKLEDQASEEDGEVRTQGLSELADCYAV